MAIIELDSSNWQKVISETTPVIVDFWAPWCPWCMRLLPVFEEVSRQYEGRLTFAKVNVEEQQEIAQSNGISGIPVLKLFCNGRNTDELVGYMTKEKLVSELDRMLSKVSDCLAQSSVLPKETHKMSSMISVGNVLKRPAYARGRKAQRNNIADCGDIQQTVQIATFGQDQEGILMGLRNFPIRRLILLHYQEDRDAVREFARNIYQTLGIPVVIRTIVDPEIIQSVIEQTDNIIKNESEQFEQILINVSLGDKMLGWAALTYAFVNGIKVFYTGLQRQPLFLPLLKLSCNEIISDAKIKILQALDKSGGTIEYLEDLTKLTGFGKPLLSYHIQGNNEAKGLVHLGLVDVKRLERGRLKIVLNTLGKIFVSTKMSRSPLSINCADCGCLHLECKNSTSPKECPNCTLEKCCCLSVIQHK